MALKQFAVFILTAFTFKGIASQTHNAVETEMFAIPISPNIFNWTYQEFDQQYRFHAALIGKPDLPYWLRYMYSSRHHSGFIFGTPPRGTKSPIIIEVIGLNRQDYETRRLTLTLQVKPRSVMAKHEVELKIDNLNVEDLLDNHRMVRLKDIFRSKLWPESKDDLYATFLASAIDLGARLPLKPNDGEGLVVRLGSASPFSDDVKNLREEVRPLSRLTNCPREYKRTSVERLFRDAGLTLDWCSFELYNTQYTERNTQLVEYLTKKSNKNTEKSNLECRSCSKDHIWQAPSLSDLPTRDYFWDITLATLLPLLLMTITGSALTAIMCCAHNTGVSDPELEHLFDTFFHPFINKRQRAQSSVELCRYGTGNTEQTHADNTSNKSLVGNSPNNSLVRPYSPKSTSNLAGNYNRPQPPPYMGTNTNSLNQKFLDPKTHIDPKMVHITTPSTSVQTPEHTHLVLEESLKLLNDAKISSIEYADSIKDRIIDLNDTADDYVPIKEGSYLLKHDLDNIVVPELTNYSEVGNSGQFLTADGVAVAPPVKTWFC